MMSLTDREEMFQKTDINVYFGKILFITTSKPCNKELNIVWVSEISKFLNLKFKP